MREVFPVAQPDVVGTKTALAADLVPTVISPWCATGSPTTCERDRLPNQRHRVRLPGRLCHVTAFALPTLDEDKNESGLRWSVNEREGSCRFTRTRV